MTHRSADAVNRAEGKPATGGVALWRRIADALEQSIAQGTFKAGTKLPAETEIAERFGVNRHTVRRAIAALTERGLLRAERGSGTYVESDRIAYPIRRRTRFSEIIGGAGHAVGGRLVASSIENADSKIARRLRIKLGTPVIRMERVRQADGVPIVASTTWLPADRFPNAARVYGMSSNSMTRMLANFDVRDYTRESTRVTAAIAEAADAESLKLALGRPLLVVESIDADTDGVPILTTRSRFVSDRVALVLET
ncbi:MAG TPA: phosphonate metabolism transcriptional regulator PhnF [Xanthobacteraceae bacterium]|nr:phosphonate metabolism transcriptional regulator PhnF [Xanthobacteraceae bacterium]